MEKLLFISPHLSTGGLPQYIVKQVEEFKDKFDIYLIEYNNLSGDRFVVQKDRLINLVDGNKFFTLGEDKSELLSLINSINPNIIHFQEIPEHFIDTKILDSIFNNKRTYNIVSTTHGSLTNPDDITYHPDRYVLVSKWSESKFTHLGIETDIWEYPIERIEYDKSKAKQFLGFEEDYKHVLMVGLFTEGKNQGEIFELAKQLKNHKIKFHFVGNQAVNFESYWKPLMDNKPDNVVWWDERNDVDNFYKAADLFYFSSKLELNPLSIKEALSYNIPCVFRRLYTYLDTYDANPLVTYLTDDLNHNKCVLLDKLYEQPKRFPKIQIKHLLTKPDHEREKLSQASISQLEKYGFEYQAVVNEPYTGVPPKEFCRRPNHISPTNTPGEISPGLGWICSGHYGCFAAHRDALKDIDTENFDYTLIFEADAFIDTSVYEFVNIVYKACEISEQNDVYHITFSDNPSAFDKVKVNDYFLDSGFHQDLAHAYMIPNRKKGWYMDRIKDCEWDGTDIWYNHMFCKHPQKRYTTSKNYVKQSDGYSLIDLENKIWSK